MKKVLIIVSFIGMLYARDTLIYVGRFPPQGYAWINDGYVVGNVGYLTSDSGIFFIDLTDKTNPQLINFFHLPGGNNFIEVHDTIAYVTTEYGLRIINVKDPLNPQIIGSLVISHYLWDFRIIDTILCAIQSGNKLCLINIKDPSSPIYITYFSAPFGANFTILDNYNNLIFAGSQGGRPLYAFDISDPLNPLFLDTILHPPSPYYPPQAGIEGIDISPLYYPYLYAGTAVGLWIVDISDPSHLQHAFAEIDTPVYDYVFIKDSLLFSGPHYFLPRNTWVWNLNPNPLPPKRFADGPELYTVDDIFVDSLYYVYVVPTRGPSTYWRIYKLEEVGVRENEKNKEEIDFEIKDNYIRIFYNLLKKENGRIYITDKTGRIFEVLRKGILQNDEILWKPKNKGTYFLVLETKNKRIIKKINIIK
jgi:hypothetical protein